MPADAAAAAMLRVDASASRKRSWRSGVHPSLRLRQRQARRILRVGGELVLLIHELGPQVRPCRTAISCVWFGWKAATGRITPATNYRRPPMKVEDSLLMR